MKRCKCKDTPTGDDFWAAVQELAAMRRHIPAERRAYSGVREALRLDTLERSKRHDY